MGLPFIHLIVFTSALAATVTGYGFVLLASPLLLLVLEPAEAVPLSIILGWVVITVLLSRAAVRRSVDRRYVIRLAAAGLLGIPLGARLLFTLDPTLLRVILGLIVATLALVNLTQLQRPLAAPPAGAPLIAGRRPPPLWTFAAGFGGGILSGAAGLGGSFMVLYLSRCGLDKHRLRATSAGTIWITSSVTLLLYAGAGRIPLALGRDSLFLIPALALGMLAGSRVFRALPERRFRQMALTFAAIAGFGTALTAVLTRSW